MTSLEELIRRRRTVRSYKERPVPEDVVVRLLRQADDVMRAFYDREAPWRLIYAAGQTDKSRLIALMDEAMSRRKPFKWMPGKVKQTIVQRMMRIPGYLIVLVKDAADRFARQEDFAAACGFMQSFSMLAWEQGLGMVWSTDDLIRDPVFLAGIGAMPGERIVGTFCLGFFDKVPKARPRTPASKKMTPMPAHGLQTGRFHGSPPIPPSVLEQLLDVAVWAPNHHHREPWRFVYSSNHLIFIAKTHHHPQMDQEDLAAVCCVIHNFRLLAREHGLVTEWVLRAYMEAQPDGAGSLDLSENETVAGVLGISQHPQHIQGLRPSRQAVSPPLPATE